MAMLDERDSSITEEADMARWYEASKKERLTVGLIVRELTEKEPRVVGQNYTLVADDANRAVEVNAAGPITITVPANVFAAGQKVPVLQIGAGQVTLAAGLGLTLDSPTTKKTGAQFGTVTVAFRSATTAILSGNIAAA